MTRRRVVITGLGALTPIGNTVKEFWDGLVRGVSGADDITRYDASKFRTRFACQLKNFNAEDFIPRKEMRKMDPFAQYALICAQEAVRDSGLEEDNVNKERVGVIYASGIGGLSTFYDEVSAFAKGDGTPRFNPFFIPKMIVDIAAGHISMKYGFTGPNFATVSACASSANAIADAYFYIQQNKADVILAGGSEAVINQAAIGGFNAMRALSERNDDPKTASRPFDKNRDGFVMGEGAATLVLEDYEHAKKRGATIYAEMTGFGVSADAYHLTAPHPEGLGAKKVMENALADASLKTSDIDYINVHGTSTPLGDVSELKAIRKVFGDDAFKLNISSSKSMTGHLLGAAGAAEALVSILSIQHNIIPPTINHFEDDPEIDPSFNLTFNEAQEREVKVALSNAFGFGGHNVSLVFQKLTD
ncbi:MAG: beta-ketoacyl-ACP synthase II [Bacteroidia bacterium]